MNIFSDKLSSYSRYTALGNVVQSSSHLGENAPFALLSYIFIYIYINFLYFEKVSKKFFFKISLLYLKCFTKNPHQSPLTKLIFLCLYGLSRIKPQM